MLEGITNSSLYSWVIIPVMIFLARICDVSIGTFRIILVSKGGKILASVLGFFEVLIWLLAITQVLQHLSNWVCFVAYGLGFASGNFIGITIEEKLALGFQALRFISKSSVDVDVLTMALRDEGYGATVLEAKGGKGKVNIIFTIVPRKAVKEVLTVARQIDPEVFVSVQDIRSIKSGYVPNQNFRQRFRRLSKKK